MHRKYFDNQLEKLRIKFDSFRWTKIAIDRKHKLESTNEKKDFTYTVQFTVSYIWGLL